MYTNLSYSEQQVYDWLKSHSDRAHDYNYINRQIGLSHRNTSTQQLCRKCPEIIRTRTGWYQYVEQPRTYEEPAPKHGKNIRIVKLDHYDRDARCWVIISDSGRKYMCREIDPSF